MVTVKIFVEGWSKLPTMIDATSVVPWIGELILWEAYTFKVKTIFYDVEEAVDVPRKKVL